MGTRTSAVTTALLLLVLSIAAPVSGDTRSGIRPEVVAKVMPHLSQPARDLPHARAATGPAPARAIPEMPLVGRPEGDRAPTTDVQRWMPSRAPAVTSWEGQTWASTWPPDPTGEVDDTYFVQAINRWATHTATSFAIYDRGTGSLVSGPTEIASLWPVGDDCADHPWGDPIVQYDALADRWLLSQGAGAFSAPYSFSECIAVSQTDDPTGAWWTYTFPAGNRFPDYPKIGAWVDAYYMTSNDFIDLNTYDGPSLWAFQRSAMLAGDAASLIRFDLPDTYFDLLPADIDGTNQPFYYNETVVSMDEATDQLYLWDAWVDWADPVNSQMNGPTAYPVNPFTLHYCADERHCIGQPGTAVTLDSLARHMMYRLAYRNLGGTEMMAVTHNVDADATKTKFRWYVFERNLGESTWNLTDQGTFGPDATNRWLPSVAIDGSGDLGIAYNISDTTSTYPSVAVSGRLYTDPPGSLGYGETVAAAGTTSQTLGGGSYRWGDYNHVSSDPTDPCTFWYTAEYTDAANHWTTSIGHFSFPECWNKSDSAVSLQVSGQYAMQGAVRLYHPKTKLKYTNTVTTGAPGQYAEFQAYRWNKAGGTWDFWFSTGTNLSAVSTISSSFKASVLGKGKYRLYGSYPGDADSNPSQSDPVVVKVMKT